MAINDILSVGTRVPRNNLDMTPVTHSPFQSGDWLAAARKEMCWSLCLKELFLRDRESFTAVWSQSLLLSWHMKCGLQERIVERPSDPAVNFSISRGNGDYKEFYQ